MDDVGFLRDTCGNSTNMPDLSTFHEEHCSRLRDRIVSSLARMHLAALPRDIRCSRSASWRMSSLKGVVNC